MAPKFVRRPPKFKRKVRAWSPRRAPRVGGRFVEQIDKGVTPAELQAPLSSSTALLNQPPVDQAGRTGGL